MGLDEQSRRNSHVGPRKTIRRALNNAEMTGGFKNQTAPRWLNFFGGDTVSATIVGTESAVCSQSEGKPSIKADRKPRKEEKNIKPVLERGMGRIRVSDPKLHSDAGSGKILGRQVFLSGPCH